MEGDEIMSRHSFFLFIAVAITVLLVTVPPAAAKIVPGAPLDYAVIHVDSISKSTPIRIQAFSADKADIGHVKKESHKKQAQRMMQQAPTLMAEELKVGLKEAGFNDVAVVSKGDALPPKHYLIRGDFTVLHPGSQQERLWVGFGAGKSKTCVEGKVADQAGKDLADFKNCRVGTWWGGSEGEIRNDSRGIGNHIAGFMHHWAEGDYAD